MAFGTIMQNRKPQMLSYGPVYNLHCTRMTCNFTVSHANKKQARRVETAASSSLCASLHKDKLMSGGHDCQMSWPSASASWRQPSGASFSAPQSCGWWTVWAWPSWHPPPPPPPPLSRRRRSPSWTSASTSAAPPPCRRPPATASTSRSTDRRWHLSSLPARSLPPFVPSSFFCLLRSSYIMRCGVYSTLHAINDHKSAKMNAIITKSANAR